MLLFVLLSPLRMVGAIQAAIISCVAFQSFTIIMLSRFYRKAQSWCLFIAILFGSSIIDFAIRVCYFEDTMLSFPEFLGRIVSVTAGYFVFKLIIRDKR